MITFHILFSYKYQLLMLKHNNNFLGRKPSQPFRKFTITQSESEREGATIAAIVNRSINYG